MGSRSLAPLLSALLLAAPLARAEPGSVQGEVKISVIGPDGKPQPKADRSGVVVYLTGYTEPPPAEVARMSQRDKSFIPSVLPIVAGQKVEFENQDVVLHNVFSRSVARKFDAGKNRPGEKYVGDLQQDGHHRRLLRHPRADGGDAGGGAQPRLRGDGQGRALPARRACRPGAIPSSRCAGATSKSGIAREEVAVEAGRASTVTLRLVERREARHATWTSTASRTAPAGLLREARSN